VQTAHITAADVAVFAFTPFFTFVQVPFRPLLGEFIRSLILHCHHTALLPTLGTAPTVAKLVDMGQT